MGYPRKRCSKIKKWITELGDHLRRTQQARYRGGEEVDIRKGEKAGAVNTDAAARA
jgi:hypothetical protein